MSVKLAKASARIQDDIVWEITSRQCNSVNGPPGKHNLKRQGVANRRCGNYQAIRYSRRRRQLHTHVHTCLISMNVDGSDMEPIWAIVGRDKLAPLRLLNAATTGVVVLWVRGGGGITEDFLLGECTI